MRTLCLGSVCLVAGALALAAAPAPATPVPAYAVMHFSPEQMLAHRIRRGALPRKEIEPAALDAVAQAAAAGTTSGVSLLANLAYTPALWNQGGCGDCWVWGSTAACSIAYGVHTGKPACFSVQFMNSNYDGGGGNGWACCGGDQALFANFYESQKKFIPWSNPGASYTDLNSYCGGTSATRASAIAGSPDMPFTAITDQVIATSTVTQSQAITNIKAVLNGGQAVAFSYFLPGAGWKDFEQFWSTASENTLWTDINSYSGTSFENGAGGHITCIVGYDDTDGSWIVLNSWGTTSGRPDGTFKIPQAMGYADYMVYGGSQMDQFEFDVYDITWPASGNTVTAAVTAPASGTTVQAGSTVTFTGSGTDSASGAALTYSWAFGDGGSATGVTASHAYTNTGTTTLTETVTLTATDGTGAKGTGTATLYVAPASRNTVTAAITSPAATVTAASGAAVGFIGAGTDSSKAATLSYAWTFGDGASAAGASASHAFTNTGTANATETVTLTVTDSTGASAKATRTVIVTPAPRDTVTAAITNPSGPAMVGNGSTLTFASAATDSSRTATLSYAWNFGDGTPTAAGPSPSHRFTCQGSTPALYNVVLTVTDSTGARATASQFIYVMPQAGNVVTITAVTPSGPAAIPSGTAQAFTCKATDTSKSAALSYYWNFGDNLCAAGPSVSHTYANPTSAPITLMVNVLAIDNTGAYAVAIFPITVNPPGAKK